MLLGRKAATVQDVPSGIFFYYIPLITPTIFQTRTNNDLLLHTVYPLSFCILIIHPIMGFVNSQFAQNFHQNKSWGWLF